MGVGNVNFFKRSEISINMCLLIKWNCFYKSTWIYAESLSNSLDLLLNAKQNLKNMFQTCQMLNVNFRYQNVNLMLLNFTKLLDFYTFYLKCFPLENIVPPKT